MVRLRPRYEAACYAQAGCPHYSVCVLADGGGDDVYNDNQWTSCVAVGSAHDHPLAVLVDESGGQGTSVCNGVALFVDNGGDDRYVNVTNESCGHAHLGASCEARDDARTGSMFTDAAGADMYERGPYTGPGGVALADDIVVSQVGGWPGDRGATVDGTGDSRVHAR